MTASPSPHSHLAPLASASISDGCFFEATDHLAKHFHRRSEGGDLRTDEGMPEMLYYWFRHASSRVPDFRVWDVGCQILEFFDPEFGLYLPDEWGFDARHRILGMNDALRSRDEWDAAIRAAWEWPSRDSVRALACCAARVIGVDAYPAVWGYLESHSEDWWVWHLIAPDIDATRLPAYLELARLTLAAEHHASMRCQDSGGLSDFGLLVWELLHLLQRFPGEGFDVIEYAVRSQDRLLRVIALETLAMRAPRESMPESLRSLLQEMRKEERGDHESRLLDPLL